MNRDELFNDLGITKKETSAVKDWVLGMEPIEMEEPFTDDSHIDFIAYDPATEIPIEKGRICALYPLKGLVLYADVNPDLGFDLNSIGEVLVEDWDGKILNKY